LWLPRTHVTLFSSAIPCVLPPYSLHPNIKPLLSSSTSSESCDFGNARETFDYAQAILASPLTATADRPSILRNMTL